jgi:hypothetical protein
MSLGRDSIGSKQSIRKGSVVNEITTHHQWIYLISSPHSHWNNTERISAWGLAGFLTLSSGNPINQPRSCE